jgi:hypothetical protein
MSTQPNTINTTKRSFIKTLMLSLAFISFGGIGSILSGNLLGKPESKTGYGSSRYGA